MNKKTTTRVQIYGESNNDHPISVSHGEAIYERSESTPQQRAYEKKSNIARKFVTLKWIKKAEIKSYYFYDNIMQRFRKFGIIHDSVYGQDSMGRGHLHFIYTPIFYFKYRDFIPKYCHINYVDENPSHIWYIHKHHRILIDDLYPTVLKEPKVDYYREQQKAIQFFTTNYAFLPTDE